jgi:hypothetical protein
VSFFFFFLILTSHVSLHVRMCYCIPKGDIIIYKIPCNFLFRCKTSPNELRNGWLQIFLVKFPTNHDSSLIATDLQKLFPHVRIPIISKYINIVIYVHIFHIYFQN